VHLPLIRQYYLGITEWQFTIDLTEQTQQAQTSFDHFQDRCQYISGVSLNYPRALMLVVLTLRVPLLPDSLAYLL
jgi:hypothetical protein